MKHLKRHSKRIVIAVAGGIVVLAGLVMVPYPGPGWLVVFAGLAILATEFDWAQEVLNTTRRYYDDWQAWVKRQSRFVQGLIWSATALVVIVTIWLLNGYGLIAGLIGLDWPWLSSPLF